MQYLLLIYGNETYWNKLSEADQGKVSQEYGEFTQSIAGSGHLKGGNELDRISTATTVRMRDGKRVVTDGPFAETKEQLGGYYLVEAKDLEKLSDSRPGFRLRVGARLKFGRSGSTRCPSPIEVSPATL